jgi:hypothetical protein
MLVRTLYGLGESFSSDGGITWTDVEPSQFDPHPLTKVYMRSLDSGGLLLLYHPDVETRTDLTAAVSYDDGETWQDALLLDDREDVATPDATVADDGTIYVVYDRERLFLPDRQDGELGEILMSAFTEEDILAGELVSEGSRLRTVIDTLQGE